MVFTSTLGFILGGFAIESIICGLSGVIFESIAHGLAEIAFLNYKS